MKQRVRLYLLAVVLGFVISFAWVFRITGGL
jgi:hypothetical protein